jgi:hypothetical protein
MNNSTKNISIALEVGPSPRTLCSTYALRSAPNMIGMRVVSTRQHHSATLRLLRKYGTLPEPPQVERAASGGGQRPRPKQFNFKAPIPTPSYAPAIPRTQSNQQPPRPLFSPTKENLDTILNELNEKCEIYK